MCANGIEKIGRKTQLRHFGTRQEAGRCFCGEVLRLVAKKRLQGLGRDVQRPGREVRSMSPSAEIPRCDRPRLATSELDVSSRVIDAWISKALADPCGGVYRDGIPNELPPRTTPGDGLCRCRPIFFESLQSFGIPNIRLCDPAARENDRWRRWDPDRGAALESRDGIDGPSQTAKAFRPVETAGDLMERACIARLRRVVDEKDVARIVMQRSQNVDAFAALRHSECTAVRNAIRPRVSEPLELRHDDVERTSPPKLEHEGDVLEEEPFDPFLRKEAEHFPHQSRAASRDAGSLPSLTEVLTRKARRHQLGALRQRLHLADVVLQLGSGKAVFENGTGCPIDLAEEFRLVPSIRHPELDAADTGEKASHLQRLDAERSVERWRIRSFVTDETKLRDIRTGHLNPSVPGIQT